MRARRRQRLLSCCDRQKLCEEVPGTWDAVCTSQPECYNDEDECHLTNEKEEWHPYKTIISPCCDPYKKCTYIRDIGEYGGLRCMDE